MPHILHGGLDPVLGLRRYVINHLFRSALSQFAKSPYWARTWIVQEITLARECLLLSHSGTWNSKNFSLLFTEFLWHHNSPDEEMRHKYPESLFGIRDHDGRAVIANSFPESRSIHSFVSRFGETKCADKRDRIYRVLGLVSGGRGFPVDYKRSQSALLLDVLEYFVPRYDHLGENFFRLIVDLEIALEVTVNGFCRACAKSIDQTAAKMSDLHYTPEVNLLFVKHEANQPVRAKRCWLELLLPASHKLRCKICSQAMHKFWCRTGDTIASVRFLRVAPQLMYYAVEHKAAADSVSSSGKSSGGWAD